MGRKMIEEVLRVCVFVGTTSGNKYQRRRSWRYELEMKMERRRETKQPYIYSYAHLCLVSER